MFPASNQAFGSNKPCTDCYLVFLGTGRPSKFGMVCDGCGKHTHIKFKPTGLCIVCHESTKQVDNDEATG